MNPTAILLALLCMSLSLMSNAAAAEWEAATEGEGFAAARGRMFLPVLGSLAETLELSFPASIPSVPGWFARWTTTVELPAEPCKLIFYSSDSYHGPTRGHHFLQVLVDGGVCWEDDMDGTNMAQRIEVTVPAGRGKREIAFRLYNKKLVTNFAVTVNVAAAKLICAGRETMLLPLEPLAADYTEYPPEPPLPASDLRGDWTRAANIVQPWGSTQMTAMWEADEWAPRFANDLGFDALIMLPPEAHNAIAVGKNNEHQRINDEQFAAALQTYRNHGMKFILYTSVMHCGHAPQWQFGKLGKERPEWAMRDAGGDVITTYGHPWLCPSTGALDYTLQYTAALVRKFDADAVMLDNNEFMYSNSKKPMCYCDSCRKNFSDYILKWFGEDGVRDILGLSPQDIRIPESDADPLWGAWLAWRNRVWAEVLETYRTELRKLNPDIVVLANTQYLYSSWILAIDRQYAHEDAVLAESRGLDGAGMAAKMTLGRAAAQRRPLWNYIGTFEDKDFRKLRSPERVRSICAASIGSGANPWIVFYGFTGAENQPSLEVLTGYMAFWAEHAELLAGGREAAAVGVLFSPESRDFTGTGILPAWLSSLLRRGVAVRGLWEPRACPPDDLDGLSVLIAPGTCLRQETAAKLAAWVRRGGTLITTPYASWADEYGRWRPQSALSAELGSNISMPGKHACGTGKVICLGDEAKAGDEVLALVQPDVTGAGDIGAFRRFSEDGRSVLALVGFGGILGEVTARLPAGVTQAQLYMPTAPTRALTIKPEPGLTRVTFTADEALALIIW